ncbi:MAG: XdhC family protein [Candidatus Parcubacteria bacterium]|nr:XdhC family protein [Candidatus Parcubacteria bacterium]
MNKEILGFLIDSIQNSNPVILMTVVSSSGHAPGREGFMMAVTEDTLFGTIGGGTIEKNMVKIARKRLAENTGAPEIFHRIHKLSAKKNASGMICGGTQTIAIHPLRKNSLAILEQCEESFLSDHDPKTLRLSFLGIECLNEIRNSPHSFMNFCDSCWFYEETIGQKNTAYIFGGGHVCLALSPVLASLGFRIAVLDERPFINTLQENKWCDQLFISPFETLPNLIKEGQSSYAFIMTPSHIHDEMVLRGLLGKNLKYIGMMASKTKVAEIFANLEKDGFSKEKLKMVHSPIGLSIKSRTPAEIAISIAAEVIQVKNNV